MRISSLSIYDFFTMIVTGYLLLSLFIGRFVIEINASFIPFFVIVYIVGLCWHKLIELLSKGIKLHRNPKMLRTTYHKMLQNIQFGEVKPERDYSLAWYVTKKEFGLGSISVLEAQEAFLRDIVLIILIYAVMINCSCFLTDVTFLNRCLVSALLFVGIFICAAVWYAIQKKTFELVWEGYFYAIKSGYYVPRKV